MNQPRISRKILIVLPNDTLGGAEQYLKMVASYHENDQVQVIFLHKTGSGQWNDISDHVTKIHLSTRSKNIGLFKLFFHFLFKKEGKFDYVFTSHVYITSIVGILINLGLIKKMHFVARESTSIFKRFSGVKLFTYRMAYRLGYKKVDLLICQTDFMKDQLMDGLPSKLKKLNTRVIANPIDLALITNQERKEPDFQPPSKYLVSAGRLITEKGFDLLIRAFVDIVKLYPDQKLLILGEGPERNNLEALVKTTELQDNVILPGRVNNVYPFFRMANVCIVSSRIEGFPNVLLQMMSQNENVVSTLCAGGIESIPGIVKIPPKDVKALTASINEQLGSGSTKDNRPIFDEFLKERSIAIFMKKVNLFLESG